MIKKFFTVGVLAMILAFSPAASALNNDAQTNSDKTYDRLDSLAYSGGDLGAVYSKESTTFKVWAPTAESVKLRLYATGSDTEDGAKELAKRGITPDVVVLDPPRKGCQAELFDVISAMNPSRIVYVSCDAATLARDLKILAERGYKTVEVTPVDMFPRTPHVECVVLLTEAHK